MSSAMASSRAVGARREAILGWGLVGFGLYQLSTAVLMAFTPHLFFSDIGPFGVQNNHYLRDLSTYNAAFGVALLVAYRRASWRVPVLCCVALQFALHSLNHLWDIDASHPRWLGPADFISLALATAILAWLGRESLRSTEEQR
jgi:hypothetical protein